MELIERSTARMKRTTVKAIADMAKCSPHTVRKLADRGYIEARRDYNGWRIFLEPMQTAETVRQLLWGTAKPQKK